MNIGEKIKKLRRSRDMTQEELAESLSVSVSAVSQWESGKTTPDISALPVLCNLFGVTSDELLGIDVTQKQAEIDRLIIEISEISRIGDNKEAYRRFREALKQYPDSYELMYQTASTADWFKYDESFTKEERDAMRDESIRLYEKILDGCTDEMIRTNTIGNLCVRYAEAGNREKADELANCLPILCQSRDFVLASIAEGEDRIYQNQWLKFNLVQFLSNRMVRNYTRENGEMLYSEDEICALHEKRIKLFELLYENGDYGYYNSDMCCSFVNIARYRAKNGDTDNSLDALEKAAEHAVAFIEFTKGDITHTSLIFKGMDNSGKGIWFSGEKNNADDLLESMTFSDFDSVRNEPRFAAVIDKLKPYSGGWR
ncbi:MAG: helix-turn-helix domain-containing protein [Eubacteriales bacterium]